MRKSPLNYLITIAFGAILWVVTAIFIAGSFCESLMLAVSTPEKFLANLRIILGVAAFAGIINCIQWFYYGGLTSTAGNLKKAKTVWIISLIIQIVVSVALLLVLIFINLTEGILPKDWLTIFGLISLHTWFFYWFSTFFMSPRTVVYIPLFKK